MLSEEELVLSICEQSERSAAVIGQIDLSRNGFDPTPVIVSSLSNIFESALVVLALEDEANDRSECYRSADRLVLSSPAASSEQKGFIREINAFRSSMTLDFEDSGCFDSSRCLDFLNSFDCFMFQFFQNSSTVRKMRSDGNFSSDFISFRNILEKILKKNMLSSVKPEDDADMRTKLDNVIGLLSRICDENIRLNQKIDELSAKLDSYMSEKRGADE
ncbi:MAG: hypothetical protein MJ079_04130 [Ruminococcus sp.]|nr:hypothetical protein [Ruminococcus sp.]